MSDLAQELAKAVTEDECLRGQIAGFLGRFQVNDLPCDKQNIDVVLLCESPHTAETRGRDIKDRYPLAGRSGKKVTTMLWKYVLCRDENRAPDNAIGALIAKECSDFGQFGIMNVSQFPLQAKAYCQEQDFYGADYTMKNAKPLLSLLRSFETILRGPGANTEKRGEQAKCVDNLMQKDLKCRLDAIGKPGILYVLCGDVAQEFFGKVKNTSTCNCNTVCVPHPNDEDWKDKEKDIGENIKRFLDNRNK